MSNFYYLNEIFQHITGKPQSLKPPTFLRIPRGVVGASSMEPWSRSLTSEMSSMPMSFNRAATSGYIQPLHQHTMRASVGRQEIGNLQKRQNYYQRNVYHQSTIL